MRAHKFIFTEFSNVSSYSFTPFVHLNWKRVDLYLPLSTRQFGKKCFSLCMRRSSQVLTVTGAMEVGCILFVYRSLPCLLRSSRVFETRPLTVYILMTFFDNLCLRHTYFLLSLFFQGILNLFHLNNTCCIYRLFFTGFGNDSLERALNNVSHLNISIHI